MQGIREINGDRRNRDAEKGSNLLGLTSTVWSITSISTLKVPGRFLCTCVSRALHHFTVAVLKEQGLVLSVGYRTTAKFQEIFSSSLLGRMHLWGLFPL